MISSVNVVGADREVQEAILSLAALPPKLARKVLRKAARVSGQHVLGVMRKNAPVGPTALFAKSLSKKQWSKAEKGIFVSIVGQKLQRAGGKNGKIGSGGFSARQLAKGRHAGKISTGISGTGKAVPIHLTNMSTLPHVIAPKRARVMAANRGLGNKLFSPTVFWAGPVLNKGIHRTTNWVNDTATESRQPVRQIYLNEIRSQMSSIVAELRAGRRR